MGYKVDIDALFQMFSAINQQAENWNEKLKTINDRLTVLANTSHMAGTAADSIRRYIENVHIPLIALLAQLIAAHRNNCLLYASDYSTNIDTDLHAVIKADDLVHFRIEVCRTKEKAIELDDDIFYVLSGIRDIFTVGPSDVSGVDTTHLAVTNYLTNLDEAIQSLEDYHNIKDFENTSEMLESLKAFIDEMVSFDRSYRTGFTPESLASSQSFRNVYNTLIKIEKEIDEKAAAVSQAQEGWEKRVIAIEEEARESREWVKWVAVGVAIVATVAVIAVTAGGATPLVCAAVGAGAGITSTAAEKFAENYVDTGSLTEGMDWSEFGKDCLISGATGAIGGCLGAGSTGSVIKQPIEKAMRCAGESVLKAGAEGLIETTWDVGEAIITKKPGQEIKSILSENVENAAKSIFVDGLTGFATGYVGGKFDVDSSSKGFGKTLMEDTAENLVEASTENGADMIWDLGVAVVDPNSSKDFRTILEDESKEFLGGFAKDFVGNEVGSVIDGGNKQLRKKLGYDDDNPGLANNILADTLSDTAGEFSGAFAKQAVEVRSGDRAEISLDEIWEDDLKEGRFILKSFGKHTGDHVSDQYYSEKELENKLKKDYAVTEDNKVEVVVFDKYAVLKEDYDKARAVAGKGAYKDQSVQDILGLPRNTAISEKNINVKEISIKSLVESEFKGKKTTNVTKLDFNKNPIYDKKKK